MRCLVMFITAVCMLFLLKLKWPKNKSVHSSLSIKMLRSECFILRKVLSERTRCSFGGALDKSLEKKVLHGRIPGDHPQTIADLLHRVKFKDNSFKGGKAHSDVCTD